MALILAVLGFFPFLSRWLTAMPSPVLGGMALLLFGLVGVSELELIVGSGLSQRETLIAGIALAVGFAIPTQAQWVATFPVFFRTVLESGVSAGGVTALILNLVLPPSPKPAAP